MDIKLARTVVSGKFRVTSNHLHAKNRNPTVISNTSKIQGPLIYSDVWIVMSLAL